ncbi:class E sortase [Streptomyces sp. NPDC058045]|uniref:class E sortase n=1 Tax=Streptomyces sp. NPDC058045 TaxID=3346311 RepID=UPI0036EB7F4A
MTALRPEREGGRPWYAGREMRGYEDTGAFEAAVEGLADPLNDPLPGAGSPRRAPRHGRPEPPAPAWAHPGRPESPEPAPDPHNAPAPAQDPYPAPVRETYQAYGTAELTAEADAYGTDPYEADAYVAPESTELAEPEAEAAAGAVGGATGGRAARRKAARRGGGRRRAGGRRGVREVAGAEADAAAKPVSRVEARRAARAAKPTAGVLVSRAVGEFFITVGVLMLLFVTYQLWWSNIRAHQQADGAAHHLQDDWAKGKGKPGAFAPGQGFAILHIPKLDVVVPIAEGIDKNRVLDRGMVGHYDAKTIKTAMPGDRTGNFAVAGHRNTHGEPFRYINRLKPGDPIIVETQDTYFVYKMASILPQTPPSNVGVLRPVPPGSGFTGPGRYITLTTCTPEFTSTYRMIVWGSMAEARPRSEGKPPALVG